MIRNLVVVSEYRMWRRLFLFSCLSRTQYTLYARASNTRVLVDDFGIILVMVQHSQDAHIHAFILVFICVIVYKTACEGVFLWTNE